MAMIDAYRIGVELVLGGDLSAGIAALIPGLERLDAGISHANAEAAELAAGLRDVAEAAPGLGLAADQMGRLSAAMASVNQAVEAWRSHGAQAVGVAGDGAGISTHPMAVSGEVVGSRTDAPAVVAALGVVDGRGGRTSGELGLPNDGPDVSAGLSAGARTSGPMKPRESPSSRFDAVMPALLAGELAKSNAADGFGGTAKDAPIFADRRTPELASPVAQVNMPGADAVRSVTQVYTSAAHVLPVYARDSFASGRSERDGLDASMLGGRDFGKSHVERVEEVIPTLTRRGREALVEPRHALQQALSINDASTAPVIPRVDTPVRERVTAFDARAADLNLVLAQYATSLRALSISSKAVSERTTQPHAKVSSPALATSHAAQRFGVPTQTEAPKQSRDDPCGTQTAIEGLSSSVTALGASEVRGIVALNGTLGKMPEEWLSAAKGAAAMGARAPGAVGAGFVPSLTAPYTDHNNNPSLTPHAHGYHPQSDQPGPVIQHITYLHLDDREIARAVTRQQLRMMGGNLSGTLRPDPSIVPQYGAHLLET